MSHMAHVPAPSFTRSKNQATSRAHGAVVLIMCEGFVEGPQKCAQGFKAHM